MTKWFEQNKRMVLIIFLTLLIVLSLFYYILIRPLAAQEENLRHQLYRVHEDTSFYQKKLEQLDPKTFTDKEKLLLVGSVPSKPNVEEVIKELEKTELETGVAIEDITISIKPNGINTEATQQDAQAKAETQNNNDTQVNSEKTPQSVPNQGASSWENILSKETLERLKDKQEKLNGLKVSYIEMVINLNGEVKDVNAFVNQLESLKRIIHV